MNETIFAFQIKQRFQPELVWNILNLIQLTRFAGLQRNI